MRRLDRGTQIRRPKKVKSVINTEKLRKAEMKLRIGADGYTPMKFLREASYTFSTTNKKYFAQLLKSLEEDPELGGDIQDEEDDEDDEPEQVTLQFSTS